MNQLPSWPDWKNKHAMPHLTGRIQLDYFKDADKLDSFVLICSCEMNNPYVSSFLDGYFVIFSLSDVRIHPDGKYDG